MICRLDIAVSKELNRIVGTILRSIQKPENVYLLDDKNGEWRKSDSMQAVSALP